MEQAPDSSLALLQKIESPETLSGEPQARWCLLITQAKDKNYIKQTSDSIIRIAVAYYEKTKKTDYLIKSYYYAGSTYFDLGDSPRAQEFFLKALTVGSKSDNHAILGRIYGNLGSIYIFQDLYDTGLDFEKKAAECFFHLNDSTNIGRTLQNIGRVYTATGQIDSALYYYLEALPFTTPENKVAIYNEIGDLYIHKDDYTKAYEYIMQSLASLTPNSHAIPVYYNLGEYYRLTSQYDSSIYYLNKCLQSTSVYSVGGAYLNLALIEEARSNWKESAYYYKKYQQLQDSLLYISKAENLQQIQSFYNYQLIEEEKIFHQQTAYKNTIYLYRLAILAIILLIAIIYLWNYFQKKRRCEREQNEKLLHQEREQSEKLLQIKEQERMETEEHLKEKEHMVEALVVSLGDKKQLNEIVGKDLLKEFHSSELYKEFMNKAIKASKLDWEGLEGRIEKISPTFAARIKILYPAIDYVELRLCYLKKTGFAVKDIKRILNLKSSSAVSNKWGRLYNKITKEVGGISDMDDFIRGF
jgi:tetratricopeptide (TPR) repeat protein